jgi:protein TonB
MFESSFVESSGETMSKSGRYMWVTGAFNAAVVVVMILVPLLYPEALPKMAITAMLSAPPPPPPVHFPITVVRAVPIAAPLDPFTAPPNIPKTIALVHEDTPPPETGAGVVSMSDTSVMNVGVTSALGIGALPPVVKVASPRLATPAKISGGVIAGNKLSGSNPVYPPIARAAHVAGAVVLHAIISKTGAIQSLAVVSGPEMLRANAVSAVQDWRYKPYLLNGEPTDVETTITVNFSFGG